MASLFLIDISGAAVAMCTRSQARRNWRCDVEGTTGKRRGPGIVPRAWATVPEEFSPVRSLLYG